VTGSEKKGQQNIAKHFKTIHTHYLNGIHDRLALLLFASQATIVPSSNRQATLYD